jgi:transglutaminase-like putative cysteine protease
MQTTGVYRNAETESVIGTRLGTYHPHMGNVSATAAPLPAHPDGQVYTTVEMMIGYARKDAASRVIRELAAGLCVPGNPRETVARIWQYANQNIEFRFDRDIAAEANVPHAGDVAEILIRPADMAELIRTRGRGIGDCDDFSMFVCALMLACGIPCRIVTVAAADSENPNAYSHVYACAYADGARISVDASHGKYCGWEAPDAALTRKLEYPVDGLDGNEGGGIPGGGNGTLGALGTYALVGLASWGIWHNFGDKIMTTLRQAWDGEI